MNAPARIGISGSGFVARMTYAALSFTPDLQVTGVLTRRPIALSAAHFPEAILTNSAEALAERSDIVFECSGDTTHAAEVLVTAGEAGCALVTLCAEAQMTVGSALLHRGFRVTEAYGDQPGALAALDREARAMQFEPLAYVNFKGFYDPDPSPENMAHWARVQRTTVRAVTSYTDGSKLQIEQALVANGLGARIARRGMIGGDVPDLADLDYLAEAAREIGAPISDYIVHPAVKGVLVLAASEVADLDPYFSVFKAVRTRRGLAYRILQPHYFVYAEIAKTLREVVAERPPLLTNGLRPVAMVVAIAKRTIPAGTQIEMALGGFLLRGEAAEIDTSSDAVPITLLDGARLIRDLEPGAVVCRADVELPDTLALRLWHETLARRAAP